MTAYATGDSVADIILLPMGVGSGKDKTMEFTFFPAAAGVLHLCCALVCTLHIRRLLKHVQCSHRLKVCLVTHEQHVTHPRASCGYRRLCIVTCVWYCTVSRLAASCLWMDSCRLLHMNWTYPSKMHINRNAANTRIHVAGWSTMYPDEEEVQNAMQVFLEQSLSALKGIDSSWLTSAGQLLQRIAPKQVTQQAER